MSMTFNTYTKSGETFNWIEGPNLANTNAAMVVRALGLEMDPDGWGGHWDLDKFESAVLIAQAVPPVEDGGMPDIQQGNFIHCGVRPGYFGEVFSELGDLCSRARAAGATHIQAA